MDIVLTILISLVALLHLYFMWFEMFAWTTRGKKIFKDFPKELFEPTKSLAANQGLYNGFLALGLIWTFFIEDTLWRFNISLFFLGCVSIAGIFGGISADRKIFMIQAFPALLAILLLILGKYGYF